MKEYTLYTIIEAVEENNEMNGGSWAQWTDADHIINTYIDNEHYFLADESEYDEMVNILNTRIMNARTKAKEDYFIMKPLNAAISTLTQEQVDKIGHFDYLLFKLRMVKYLEELYEMDFIDINSFMVDKKIIVDYAIVLILRCVNKN